MVKFINKFEELKIKCRVEDPCQTLYQFKLGLRAKVHNKIIPHQIYNVDEAFQLALKIEKSMRKPFFKNILSQAGETSDMTNEVGKASRPNK